MSEPADTEPSRAIRLWLEDGLKLRGWDVPELSRRSGVSRSTIYRAMALDWHGETSTKNLKLLAEALSLPLPPSIGIVLQIPGFSEPELRRLEGAGFVPPERTANQGVWEVRNRLLELAGYLPGDRVWVELGAEPEPGDVVCAQIYDLQGGAETVLRIYQPPYLMTATLASSPATRPWHLEDKAVQIMGTVVAMTRHR